MRFLFVDDGSTDQTAEFLQNEFRGNPHIEILKLARNQGKAEAIRQGFVHLTRKTDFSQLTWVGFWDADLATPLVELTNMLKYCSHFYPGAQAIFASRVAKLGSEIHRSPLRHYLGRLFVTLVDSVIGVYAYDSQCGAKLFKPHTVEKAFGAPFLSRWIFDVEIILRLRGTQLVEYPLMAWKDIPGSKIKIGREIVRVLWDIFRIRQFYIRRRR